MGESAARCLVLLTLALPAWGDSAAEIENGARRALERLVNHAGEVAPLLARAEGILVFPQLVKTGFGAGSQYGEGVLLVGDRPVAYYATAGAEFGLKLGVGSKSEVILFLDSQVLAAFRNSQDWEPGTDVRVALPAPGAGALAAAGPVVGFIFSSEGPIPGLSLEGSRIERIAR